MQSLSDGSVRVTIRSGIGAGLLVWELLWLVVNVALFGVLALLTIATVVRPVFLNTWAGRGGALLFAGIVIAVLLLFFFSLRGRVRVVAWILSGVDSVEVGPDAVDVRRESRWHSMRASAHHDGDLRVCAYDTKRFAYRSGRAMRLPGFDTGNVGIAFAGGEFRVGLNLTLEDAEAIRDALVSRIGTIQVRDV